MSDWICHVKAFATEHKLKYGEALKNPKCSASYTRKAKPSKPTKSESSRLKDMAGLVKKI
jgi:hypothetical protein